MAFNSGLNDVFPGFEFDGTYLKFPLSTFPGLSSSEAHATRGDWRKLFFSLCAKLQEYIDSAIPNTKFAAYTPMEYNLEADPNLISRHYMIKFTSTEQSSDIDVVDELTITETNETTT